MVEPWLVEAVLQLRWATADMLNVQNASTNSHWMYNQREQPMDAASLDLVSTWFLLY